MKYYYSQTSTKTKLWSRYIYEIQHIKRLDQMSQKIEPFRWINTWDNPSCIWVRSILKQTLISEVKENQYNTGGFGLYDSFIYNNQVMIHLFKELESCVISLFIRHDNYIFNTNDIYLDSWSPLQPIYDDMGTDQRHTQKTACCVECILQLLFEKGRDLHQ